MSGKAAAQAKKAEGNNFYKAKQYDQAIRLYTEAIELDPSDHTFWSNRAACYADKGSWEESAADARQCVIIDKSFVKGYFRLALALQNMDQLDQALDAVKRGLGVDPRNADLKRKQSDIETEQRRRRVEAATQSARKAVADRDFAGALNHITTGLRLDPDNDELKRMEASARPQFEAQERSRKSGMSPVELLKEQGDDKYRAAQFEEAITLYTRCLSQTADKSSELAIKVLSNRAACYKQLSNFDGVVNDTTMVLEARPTDVKNLIRRAQAFEACEKYRLAMEDVRNVLAQPMSEVGKANYDIANGMQHRLTRVVQQMRSA